jgi:DNA-binding transcriptional regulator YiaG
MCERITHERIETLRVRLGLSVEGMCMYLRVSRSTYWLWRKRGVSGPARQLIRLMEEYPRLVLGTLAPDEKEEE